MEKADLIPLEQLAELERDQLRQSLEFINNLNKVISKRQTDSTLEDFELGWLGIKDEDKDDE